MPLTPASAESGLPPVAQPLIEVQGLTIDLVGGDSETRLVHGVDLTIAPGERVALVGESGSGKSITAQALIRLGNQFRYGGSVRFAGQELLTAPESVLRGIRGREIGMIFQEPMSALNPLYSVGDQICEVLELHLGLTRSQARTRAIELLAQTQIREPERRFAHLPHQLSGGQRQRAMIAMALACQPKLVIADEPTTALDVTVQAQIMALLQGLQREIGMAILLITAIAATTAAVLNLWRWKVELPHATWADWNGYAQLLVWFTWPAWPLALWTLWRWRHQLFSRNISRHLALPAWLCGVTVAATLTTGSSDRTLLLALPALATLAAFALPTLQRQVAALIDWFTLLFFSGCAFIIWVVWIAMQTGVPSQPAANVARLAPGFEPGFSLPVFAIALAATVVWAWLVHWRVGRHRAAIWKSLVLPAGGAALCWLLLMTLWMPLLNYAQGYKILVERTTAQLEPVACVETMGLSQGQIAAFQFYGNLQLRPAQTTPTCPWLLAEPGPDMAPPAQLDNSQWNLVVPINHPTDGNQSVLVFKQR